MADTTATPVRPTARTLTLAGRRAAPPPPAAALPSEVAALVAQAQMALTGSLALLQPGVTAQSIHQATGRAIRSATLLKRACAALVEGGAA